MISGAILSFLLYSAMFFDLQNRSSLILKQEVLFGICKLKSTTNMNTVVLDNIINRAF